jgi:benzylsuccinate CoA-transferase BbsF subunit
MELFRMNKKINAGPLSGIRITEFTSAWAGPYATCLLGFLGAEVIKVESQQRLDHSRLLSFSTGKKFSNPNQSSVFNSLNLNKLSVTLNLKEKKAVEIAGKLAGISDVVMENMRPGVISRLGLDYEALRKIKPDLIYISSSACGQNGPEREYVGYAPTFAALGGICHITGYPDWPPSNLMGAVDLRSATTSAFAILAALCFRQRTGEGQYIDLSSQETISVLTGNVLMDYLMNQRVPTRKGNQDEIFAPHSCYPCRGEDKWISIAVTTEEEWVALCQVMERPDLIHDNRFADMAKRRENLVELDRIIGEWTKDQDYYNVMEQLQKVGVAAAPSLSGEGLFKDPHIKERGAFYQVDHPALEKDWVLAPPWKLSESPASIRRHAPDIGEHNDHVFHTLLGMSRDEIEDLKEKQVIY